MVRPTDAYLNRIDLPANEGRDPRSRAALHLHGQSYLEQELGAGVDPELNKLQT